MAVPLKLTCDCGRTMTTESGQTVTCECGRRYDTSRIPSTEYRRVETTQTRMRLWARIGLLVVGLCAVLAWVAIGWTGVFLVVPTASVIWYKAVLPAIKRRQEQELAQMPTWDLEAGE